MRSLLVLSALLAGLGACASIAEDSGVSADDLVTGGVCSTLDYGPRADAKELYRFFASNAELETAAKALVASGFVAQFTGAGATVAGVDSDERAVRLVGEVFEGYRKVFPEETAGLDKAPPVVIVQAAPVNAFALGNFIEDGALVPKSPWCFFVNSGLLAHGNTDDELRGVIAHELGHLILQTFRPDVQARVRHTYTLGTESEDGILGAAQPDDPTLAPAIGRLLQGQTRNGAVAHLGMNVVAPGIYIRLLGSQLRPTPATQEVCASVQPKLLALGTKQMEFLPGAAAQDLTPRIPNATELAELEALTADAMTAIEACAAPNAVDVGSLGAISALLQGLPPSAASDPSSPVFAQIQAGMHPLEQEVDAEMPTATFFDRVVRAEPRVRNDIVAIRSSLDMSRVRVYDYEEDADDASMRVLHAIGKDPHGIGNFTLSLLPAEQRAACIADVAAGKHIGFGEAYDVHPLPCWRYYHAQQFTKALETCSPAPTKRALKTSLPLIANDPASVSGIPQR
ncbi:MAG: M48 family metalloprotease [Labilithrix sp.]|nr:M48 family metalloprotease [Labilithrix sp.]MCW5810229.1 M48 family metalloprotease [Labilithrix sp.]